MTREQLTQIYERFFELGAPPPRAPTRWYRRKVTSLRLQGCQLLVDLVQSRKPARVLDLGSGMTSIVLRELQRETEMFVVTTDTDRYWLDMTLRELKRDGLNTDHCHEQPAFEAIWEKMKEFDQRWTDLATFDLISVDIGNTDYRVSLAPKLVEWCAPNGILVCDDYRLRNYGERMNAALQPYGFTLTELPETEDQFGQTLGIAERQ